MTRGGRAFTLSGFGPTCALEAERISVVPPLPVALTLTLSHEPASKAAITYDALVAPVILVQLDGTDPWVPVLAEVQRYHW